MTKYNENVYYYTLFEVGCKGYVLKEKNLAPDCYEQEEEEYFKFSNLIDEKLYKGSTEKEILEELGSLYTYDIKTHKAKIKTRIQDFFIVMCEGESQNKQNTMYHIKARNKIEDFSQLLRHDPSRLTMFLNNLKNNYYEDFQGEIFLN